MLSRKATANWGYLPWAYLYITTASLTILVFFVSLSSKVADPLATAVWRWFFAGSVLGLSLLATYLTVRARAAREVGSGATLFLLIGWWGFVLYCGFMFYVLATVFR